MSPAPSSLSLENLSRRYPFNVEGGRTLDELLRSACSIAGTIPTLLMGRIAALEGEDCPDLSSLHGVLFLLDSVASALRAAQVAALSLPALNQSCRLQASSVAEGVGSVFQVQPTGSTADLVAAASDLAATTAAMLRDELALRANSDSFSVLGLYGIHHAAASLDALTVAAHEAYELQQRASADPTRGLQ